MVESRSRGQPVSMISMKRPGRADMAPTRSDSMAASSSACVISSTVAPVRRHSRKTSSPIKQPRLRVERAERLVEQNEARLQHQRARDADALPHAAGQLRRIGLGKVLQSHEGECIVDAAADLRRGNAAPPQSECGVVPHRQPGEARVFLKHDADAVGDFAVNRLAFERDSAGASASAGRRALRERSTCRNRTARPRQRTHPCAGRDRSGRAHAPAAGRRRPR